MAVKFLNSVNADSGVLYVDAANDRVGIGTTSPADKLQVQGNLAVPAGVIYNGAAANSAGLGLNNAYFDASGYYGIRFFSSLATVGSQTERMRITNTGNVGIGTTSPGTKLEVSGSTQVITIRTSYPSDSSQRGAFLWKDGANITGSIDTRYDGTTVDMYFGSLYNSGYNSTTRLVIKGNGNVGIGTTSPGAKLDVQGELHLYDNGSVSYVESQNQPLYLTSASDLRIHAQQTGGDIYLDANGFIKFREAGSDVMAIDGGNVGIGTTSPSAKLHIHHTSEEVLRIDSGNTGAIHFFENTTRRGILGYSNGTSIASAADAGDMVLRAESGSKLHLAIAGTSRLTVSGSNIGIGTASPSEKLHVVGDTRIEGNLTVNGTYTQIDTDTNTTEQWNVTNDGTGPAVTINQTGAQDIMDVQDDGTSVFYIEDGGNVGIGTTNPTTTLDVRGDVVVESENTPTVSVKDTTNNLVGRLRAANSYVYLTADHGDSVNSSRIVFQVDGDSSAYVTNGLFAAETSVQFTTYGSGSETGTAAYALAVDSSGNVIETSYIPSSSSTDFVAVTGDTMSGDLNFEDSNGNTRLTIGNIIGSPYEATVNSSNYHLVLQAKGTGQGQIRFKTGTSSATEKMRILENGNVGIGTTSPIDKLHVEGVIQSKKQLLPSTSGTAGWYKIGTLEDFVQGGSTAVIEIAGHQGYNATNSQDYLIKLFIKTSNGNAGGPNGQGFNSWYERTGGNSATIEFKWDNSATNDYDLYMYIPTHSLRSWYSVKKGTGTWEHAGTSATDPGANSASVLKATSLFNILDANVGIGTTTPGAKLDVNGEIFASSNVQISATGAVGKYYIRRPSDGSASAFFGYNSADNTDFGIYNGSGGGNVKFWSNNGIFQFNNTASSELMRITSAGNVGIGTTSPDAHLHVSASSDAHLLIESDNTMSFYQDAAWSSTMMFGAKWNGTNQVYGATTRGAFKMVALHDGDNSPQYLAIYGANHGTAGGTVTWNTVGFAQDEDGNVGIGTTSPGAKLDINTDQTSQIPIRVTHNNYNDWLIQKRRSDDTQKLGIKEVNTNGGMGFATADAVRMVIDSSGNVGIGTTSPAAKLEVFGTGNTLRLDSDANGSKEILFRNVGTGTATIKTDGDLKLYVEDAGKNILFDTTGGEKMRITAAGNVGIGTSNPQSKLHVAKAGNSNGGSMIIGPTGSGTAKWSYLAGTHYNQDTGSGNGSGSAGMAIIGSLSASTYNRVYVGGGPYEINPATEILFFTHTATTHNLGGSQRMVINSSGNVGIGTTSPDFTLDVEKDVDTWVSRIYNTGSDANAQALLIRSDATAAHDATVLGVYADSGYKMVVKSTGNVGIGTSNPVSHSQNRRTLVVSDTTDGANVEIWGNGSGGKSILQSVGGNTYVGNLANGNGAGTTFITSGAGNTYTTILANGNVGIGTTNPTAKLTVQGDDADIFLRSNDYTIARLINRGSTGVSLDTGLFSLFTSDGTTNNVEKIRLDAGGYSWINSSNVGIGTTTPNAMLDVNKTTIGEYAYFGSGAIRQLRLSSYNTTSDHAGHKINASSSNGEITLATNSVAALTVKNDQTVQLNAYGAGYLKSDANGVVSVDTSTIEDTLDSVTDRGATTTNSISVGTITLTDDPASSNGTFVKVYEDTHKRMYTANLDFSFTAAGTYNFNLVFANSGGYQYELTAVNSRNGLYRNFGTLKDSSYIYWESDEDFTHRAEGDLHMISSYSNGMYFSADTTYFLSDGVTDTEQTGTANWSYAIVRYSVYIPYYAGDSTGTWKLHLTTYGDTGSSTPQFVLA